MSSSTTQPGAVLLLGGTGKVGSRTAPLMQATGIPTLVASRSGKAPAGLTGVKFDWDDKSTWEPLFATPIQAVLLIGQSTPDEPEKMKAFIDLARAKGTSRFVLLSASSIEEGGPLFGQAHRYLRELGHEGKVGWAVLRPTWFHENFLQGPRQSIKEKGEIYSGMGSGLVPWISCEDIGAVGVHALTSPQPPNRDFLILGPELLTYNDLAEIFTSVLGRKVTHHEFTEAELAAHFQSFGVPAEFAPALAAMETAIKNGAEARTNDVVKSVLGREPRTFKDFVEANKAFWT